MRRVIARMGLALGLILLAQAVANAEAGRRMALVVGIGAYQHVSVLPNPPDDARLMADTLSRLGFILVRSEPQTDLDNARFDRAVQAFGEALVGAEVGLFYYAGHGLQVQGTNWLVPVGADPTRPRDLDFQMVDANLVLRQMDGARTKLNVLILDACRVEALIAQRLPHGSRRAAFPHRALVEGRTRLSVWALRPLQLSP